jgi:hypothetical protein
MVGDQRDEHGVEMREPARQRRGAVGLQPAVGEVGQPIALGPDQPPAGRAKARVESEQDQPSFSITASETS